MQDSGNLGIHALLTEEGFAVDGSYHYVGTVTSGRPSRDARFSDTLNRIKTGKQRFEKSRHADDMLVERACNAIISLEHSANHLVLIVPPFASPVWKGMGMNGYEYIGQAHDGLRRCSRIPVLDYSNPELLKGVNDCEFIDGFHGGDTIAARILLDVGEQDDTVLEYLDLTFVQRFLDKFSGQAAGATTSALTRKRETDFLKLGCGKNSQFESNRN